MVTFDGFLGAAIVTSRLGDKLIKLCSSSRGTSLNLWVGRRVVTPLSLRGAERAGAATRVQDWDSNPGVWLQSLCCLHALSTCSFPGERGQSLRQSVAESVLLPGWVKAGILHSTRGPLGSPHHQQRQDHSSRPW